jgi:hypothetical protein
VQGKESSLGTFASHVIDISQTMDNTQKFSLENLSNNHEFNFLHSILNNENEDNYDYDCCPYDVINLSCTYIDEFEYANLRKVKNEINLLSLNVQSLSAKFSAFINHLRSNNCEPDVILGMWWLSWLRRLGDNRLQTQWSQVRIRHPSQSPERGQEL